MASTATKDYEAIASRQITTPANRDRPSRLLVYSRNKKGKSTFCATAPDVLILDPEEGTDKMYKRNPRVWHVQTWDDIDDCIRYLRLKTHPFKWFAVDGLTKICNMALRWVMNRQQEISLDRKPVLVHKQHYGQAGEMVKQMMLNCEHLGIGLIYTAQERMIETESEEEDEDLTDGGAQFVPDLPKGVRSFVNSNVDVIGRLYIVKTDVRFKKGDMVVEKTVNQRRLWIAPSVNYDTGYRSDHPLPDMVKNPTVPRIDQLIRTGKVTAGG